jgi:ATP-dependent DNA helicase RecG
MPTMNLNELLGQPEGKTLEFKRNLSSPEKVLKTLIAFANTSGGIILLGVEDGTRHVRGLGMSWLTRSAWRVYWQIPYNLA